MLVKMSIPVFWPDQKKWQHIWHYIAAVWGSSTDKGYKGDLELSHSSVAVELWYYHHEGKHTFLENQLDYAYALFVLKERTTQPK